MTACRLDRAAAVVLGVWLTGAVPVGAQTARLSVSTTGAQADGPSDQPAVDHAGRFVAFRSSATNLVASDTNGASDVFVRDRDTDADGVFDEPGAVATTRVSVATGGAQANAASDQASLGADGRYVVFVSAATNLVTPPDSGFDPITAAQVYRHDRQTGETRLVSRGATQSAANADCRAPVVSQDGRYVAFSSRATNLVAADPGNGGGVFLRDMDTGVLIRLNEPLPIPRQPPQPGGASYSAGSASIDAAGTRVAYSIVLHSFYRTFSSDTGELRVYDIATGTTRASVAQGHAPQLLDGARALGYLDATTGGIWSTDFRRGGWLDLDTGAAETLTFDWLLTPKAMAWSPGGRYAAYTTRDWTERDAPNPDPRPEEPYLFDRAVDDAWLLPVGTRLGPLDAAGRFLVFSSGAALVTDDTNNAGDVFTLNLASHFDADADGLDDRWEQTVGLSASSGAGADGPSGDPDGDGVTSADELARGTHPRGSVSRYLAEGASGAFFDTQIALVNPSTSAVSAVVRFSTDGGQQRWRYLRLPAQSRRTVDAETLDGLEGSAFATVVESDGPVVVDRRMAWGGGGYGAHGESAVTSAQAGWYFAEGATGGPFDLFYLLQNPANAAVTVDVTYLQPAGGAPILRNYTLPPRSRTTIHVDEVAPALAAADVSASIVASQPIIAERAMYVSDATLFRGGHASAGIAGLSPSWFFAEGATGGFFDLFLLLANPGTSPVTVTVDYLTDGGTTRTKDYAVAPQSRRTVWVDDESFGSEGRALADAAVSMRVSATGPIAAERAMWWPGSGSWQEGHAAAGATSTATRWAMADGSVGGSREVRTYVLIANPGSVDASVRVTLLLDEAVATPLTPQTITVPAHSRFTYDVAASVNVPGAYLHERRFGVLVESLAPAAAPVVVERAVYWTAGGVAFEAGLGALAVPLP
jgi:hypothetical protein